MEAFATGVVGGAVLLALAFSVVSLWVSTRGGSSHELLARVSALRTELTDLADRVDQWQKRDRVRRVREAKEESQEASPPPASPVDSRAARLSALRRAAKLRSVQ